MKTAIYIDSGSVQLVLTPEDDFEKNALGSFEDKDMTAKVMTGQFYDCAGGWMRQRDVDRSLIIRATKIAVTANP